MLNQSVRRNLERFPPDFRFELTRDEIAGISQFVTSSNLKVAKRVTVFTEQGVAMLSSVLRSKRAIAVNVEIMRTFVKLRQILQGAMLIDNLLESLNEQRIKEVEAKWAAESEERIDAVDRGELPTVDGPSALRDLRSSQEMKQNR